MAVGYILLDIISNVRTVLGLDMNRKSHEQNSSGQIMTLQVIKHCTVIISTRTDTWATPVHELKYKMYYLT